MVVGVETVEEGGEIEQQVEGARRRLAALDAQRSVPVYNKINKG